MKKIMLACCAIMLLGTFTSCNKSCYCLNAVSMEVENRTDLSELECDLMDEISECEWE